MVKWLSDPTEAQRQAACFPNQAWQCPEPAQVGLGCIPRSRSEGSRVGRWRSAPQRSLAEFNRAHWLQVGASLPGCAPGRALVPLQINWAMSKGEASELAGAQPSSTAITCHHSVSYPLDGTADCAHKQTQEPQDSSSGIPSARVWNVNDVQERNPGLGEAVLKIPGIKEDCVYREAFQCIICVCCEASIRGTKVPTELLLNFSLLR